MKINKKGFSLVETLIMISLTGVAVAGLSKAIEKSYVTSNVIETQQITRKFKNSVYHIFNNNCKNFFPNTEPAYYDQNNPAKINKMPYIFNRSNKSESIFKGFIETVDITVSSQNNIHKFNLYYKYSDKAKALRDMKTKDSKACTPTDKKGCYHITCNINYNHNLPTTPCNPLDCIFDDRSKSVLTNLCDDGEFLVRVTGNKANDCLGCPTGETLIGTIKKGGNLEPMCLKRKCPDGEVAVGIKPKPTDPPDPKPVNFIMDCQEVACPSTSQHKVLKLNPVSGKMEMKCEPICHGGQISDPLDNNKCKCPAGKNPDRQGNCV